MSCSQTRYQLIWYVSRHWPHLEALKLKRITVLMWLAGLPQTLQVIIHSKSIISNDTNLMQMDSRWESLRCIIQACAGMFYHTALIVAWLPMYIGHNGIRIQQKQWHWMLDHGIPFECDIKAVVVVESSVCGCVTTATVSHWMSWMWPQNKWLISQWQYVSPNYVYQWSIL